MITRPSTLTPARVELSLLATTPVRGDDAHKWARRCVSDEERAALCDEVAKALRKLHDRPLAERDHTFMYDPYSVAAERIRESAVLLSNFSPRYGVTSPPENQTELRALFDALGKEARGFLREFSSKELSRTVCAFATAA